jgi:hypothetical protein
LICKSLFWSLHTKMRSSTIHTKIGLTLHQFNVFKKCI